MFEITMNIWSSHLLDNVKQSVSWTWKIHVTQRLFEPMTSAMPVAVVVRALHRQSQKSWVRVSLRSPEFFRFMRQLPKLSSKCEGIGDVHLSFKHSHSHITLLSRYDSSLCHGTNMSPTNWPATQLCDCIAQWVRALHRHRRGHGF